MSKLLVGEVDGPIAVPSSTCISISALIPSLVGNHMH